MQSFEFFYDFSSPYSYLASTQVERVAREAGAAVRFRPFFLGGVFKAVNGHPPFETPAKFQHMIVDLARWAKRYRVPFNMPAQFPVPSITALRAALAAEKAGQLVPFSHAMFRAVWADSKEIGDPAQIVSIARAAGLDAEPFVAAAAEHKDALRAQTEEAVSRGAFGAPTFFVGDELFLGNDRLDFVKEALLAAK